MLNLDAFWKLRLMFPELTESQFQVLMLYAFGLGNESIAGILNCSVNAIKLSLRRIKENLNVEKLEMVRVIYHCRIQTAMMAPNDFPSSYYEKIKENK
ncbi:helix-turn-helix transcriptional regulator [Yersinia pekkanenii]|uniref:Bacterial regulatory proteins, luxR family n=1 Tax=Yersinia pekkanenii TaxID=1288385 RepID=A0A0T9QVT1_9GAMM|nr:sigma factor-like helix-turn-helix DNA-binding protein [Yersinia pekkanenii]CNI31232.1 Bacterial regulatory proteins%2C luxR family [Yersinia pekkanenii]CRY68938.1 Bacterial regulatory proteins%2C luxR family [Yersinia pekkanenii]